MNEDMITITGKIRMPKHKYITNAATFAKELELFQAQEGRGAKLKRTVTIEQLSSLLGSIEERLITLMDKKDWQGIIFKLNYWSYNRPVNEFKTNSKATTVMATRIFNGWRLSQPLREIIFCGQAHWLNPESFKDELAFNLRRYPFIDDVECKE